MKLAAAPQKKEKKKRLPYTRVVSALDGFLDVYLQKITMVLLHHSSKYYI